MSILKQKLDTAAEQFQIHNFKEALALYEDCIAFCYRTRETQGVIFNIMTTKAALQSILGQHDKAMTTLAEVLRTDPNHYLALLRRSQVYKKRGKFNRALKDLEILSTYCPDNLQLTAMRLQIENLKSKNKGGEVNSSEESESQDEFDEQLQLNFSNLKKIDRKSCSIMITPTSGRKSRVTISGDTAFEYEAEDNEDKSLNSTSISKEQAKEKYLRTFKEIEMDNDQPQLAPAVVVKPNTRSKSILKNKFSSPSPSLIADKKDYGGRESKLVEKIRNIEGKMISSNHEIDVGSEKGVREVEFRKSIFASQEKEFSAIVITEKKEKAKSGARKSCLKRCSFENVEEEIKTKPVRKSKFEMMSRNSIDGVVIKNRNSVDLIKEEEPKKNEEDSDCGSEYNIFGSKELVLSKEMSDKLGLNKKEEPKAKGKPRANGGKSILKKNSILESSRQSVQKVEVAEQKIVKKAKKSVMFTKSRFAE